MGRKFNCLVLAATKSICLLVIALLFAALFTSYLIPLDSWKWQITSWRGDLSSKTVNQSILEREPLELLLRRLVRGDDRTQLKKTGFSCHSDLHSKLCLTYKPVRINNTALEVYISSNQTQENFSVRSVRPYARQQDEITLRDVTPVHLIQGNINSLPTCQFVHDVPVVVFSTAGFTGNLFHEFDEIIIPLFITCYHFQAHLRFVITDHKPWWVRKYNRILSHLSRYDVINPAKDGGVHCFTGAVVGLKFHDTLALNYTDIPGGYSMFDFRQFLRQAYNLQVKNVSESEKPVLMLVSRQKSRKFLNEGEMIDMMEELGFEVITTTPYRMSNLDKFSSVVNSCSVMVGAHGAGLTNELFLPGGAVVVQVVPLGLDWASSFYYRQPTNDMGLHYLEYKIDPKESSLLDAYGPDDPVIRDPESIFAKGYFATRAIYVDGQNLKIDLLRFRETLIAAKKLIGQKMSAN